MNNTIYVFLMLLLILFYGCNEEVDNSDNLPITVVNGIPKFNSLEDFYEYSTGIESYAKDERSHFEVEHNYYSMKSAYDDAWVEYDSLKSYDEFLSWKAVCYEKWTFEENDEAFFRMPILRTCDAYAININGEVIINGVLHNLKNGADKFYEMVEKPILKSTSLNGQPSGIFENECAQNDGKRRVEVGLYNQGFTSVLSVIGYTKYLWRWNRYDTKHYFELGKGIYIGSTNKCITVERRGGPAFFDQSYIVNNRFQADGEGISFRFYTQDKKNIPSDMPNIMTAKGWTRGVPEEFSCEVMEIGNNGL